MAVKLMSLEEFLVYMNRLEQRVIVPGIARKRWGKETQIPIQLSQEERLGRRAFRHEFVAWIGTRFVCDVPAVIDYYGMLKRSIGFMRMAATVYGYGLRYVVAKYVPFNSIYLEDVEELAAELGPEFERWKAHVRYLRFEEGEVEVQRDCNHADAMGAGQEP